MLPKPSLCLNIPKTGSSWMRHFFDAADWLELKRRCGLGHCTAPLRASLELVRMGKRYGPAWGNINCRARDHHAGYSSLPESIRRHPKLCSLRGIPSWYCSAFLFYTHVMKDTLLDRAIRLLVDGEECVRNENARALLMRHRTEFRERFEGEAVRPNALEGLSVEFFLWFQRTIRMEVVMNRWAGMAPPGHRPGFLTLRTITILFEDPGRVFSMAADELHGYFDSGRYLRDVRCEFVLDFDRLSDELCAVMIDALGYTAEIVHFLRENTARKNVSAEERKPGVMRALDRSALFAQILEEEVVYGRYLLPLAGATRSTPPAGPATVPSVRPGRRAAGHRPA